MDDGMNPAPWQNQNNQTEYTEHHDQPSYTGQSQRPPYEEERKPPSKKGRKRKKKRRKSKNYLLRIFIALLIAAAVVALLHVEYFDVTEVTVSGNEYLTEEQILKGTKINTGRNIFDIHVLWEEHRIKKNRYVEDVDISRKLPDKITVNVTEKTGLAQFVHGKKYVVTDNDGKAIEVVKNMRNITLVEGVSLKSVTAGKKVEPVGDADLDRIYKLLRIMDDGDLYFKSVSIENDRVTACIYDQLKVTGSYSNVIDAIESETLKTVVYDLYQKGKSKGTIKVSGENYCSFTE